VKIKLLAVTSALLALGLLFQNCGSKYELHGSLAPIAHSNTEQVFKSKVNSANLKLDGQTTDLAIGSQVKWFGILPTITFSHESIDADRFGMILKELRGRTNIVSILYVSEHALNLARSKGLTSQRRLSALKLLEEKIKIAEKLGFKIAIELTPLFFNFDPLTLKYDIRSLKDGYQSEWAAAVKVFKRHPSVVWFYPYDEPYWAAKNAGIPYSTMESHLNIINRMIKADFPDGKIVFIEAFAVINENFVVPPDVDYAGIDCYGNFDNCYGESIPSYFSKLAAKMQPHQKFILIPDAFDFKAGDENGHWQNNVITQSKKFLEFSRIESRVEAIILFLYNSPLDIALNLEKLASTRQGALLNLYYDQVSLANQQIIKNQPADTFNIHISYKDIKSRVVNIETNPLKPEVSIAPVDFIDLSVSRPLLEPTSASCRLISPDGSNIDCLEIMYKQARYKVSDLKKGAWTFEFSVNGSIVAIRKIILKNPYEPSSLKISCPSSVKAGSNPRCVATAKGKLVSGYWMVNGSKYAGSEDKLRYQFMNVPAGTYQVQGYAVDAQGLSILSNVLTVTVRP
jgi:hypothetical protein